MCARARPAPQARCIRSAEPVPEFLRSLMTPAARADLAESDALPLQPIEDAARHGLRAGVEHEKMALVLGALMRRAVVDGGAPRRDLPNQAVLGSADHQGWNAEKHGRVHRPGKMRLGE